MKLRRSLALPLLAVALCFGSVACSDDTKDKAKDTLDSAKDDAKQAADDAKDNAAEGVGVAKTRAAAIALQGGLKANETARKDGGRSVKAINEVADKIPGSPDVSGVDDADDDGLDDDGKVLITVDDHSACLTIEENGTGSDIADGAC